MERSPERTKETGRLNALRKYIPTPEDAAIVKEMIAEGLSDEDILHALGHVDSKPGPVLPNGHKYSNQMTTEQQEREEQAAGLGQPGEDGMGGEGEGDGEDDGQEDILTHVAGLLSHVSRKKAKKAPKKGPNTAN